MLLTFILAFSITSCAKNIQFAHMYVDEPLQEYVRDYNLLLNYHCPKFIPTKNYAIVLEDKLDKDTWVGVCNHKMNGYSIQILKPFWDKADVIERRQLMYHELSHCILDRDHEEKLPGHYMYPVIEPVPYKVYIQQTIDDIEAFCKKL